MTGFWKHLISLLPRTSFAGIGRPQKQHGFYRVILAACIGLLAMAPAAYSQQYADSLLQRKEYFKLRRYLATLPPGPPSTQKLYYQALLSNFFNKNKASATQIDRLTRSDKFDLSPEQRKKLGFAQVDNEVKLYEYKKAYEAAGYLLEDKALSLTQEERTDLENDAIIWKALSSTPAQKMTIGHDVRIPFIKDAARLINIRVGPTADSSFAFVFDTGANLSVITQSYADSLHLQPLDASFKVRAITGIKVDATAGVCPELHIGDITVRHVVFIVFPDSALQFAGGVYKINGIIGFPVIEQMGQVSIENDGYLTVPKQPQSKALYNFGLEQLVPVVELAVGGDSLAFTFDTGAQTTLLNQPYFERYKALIEAQGKKTNLRMGGAGGFQTIPAYSLQQWTARAGLHPVTLPVIQVKTVTTGSNDGFYYGNIGQDLMQQFSSVVINFRDMYIDFIP